MMHGRGKSDFAIVAVKPATRWSNPLRIRGSKAETKGNAGQQSTCRTQSRASVSQALKRIRQTFAVMTRGRSRMRKSCMYGTAGALSNGRPYRDCKPTHQPRESNDTPSANAFCRVAPSVRLSDFAIFAAGVLLRADDFNSRTSCFVHSRRFAITYSVCSKQSL
jgi:hypothetical protein